MPNDTNNPLHLRTGAHLLFAVILILASSGCAKHSRSFQMGLIYWPPMGEKTPQSLLNIGLQRTTNASDLILIQLPWSPQNPDTVTQANFMATVAKNAHRQIAIALDWQEPTRHSLLNSAPNPWSFADPATTTQFLRTAQDTARRYHPAYFVLGIEVNYYAKTHPDDFAAFVDLYRAARTRIKQISPTTKVLVTFQYELLTARDPNWKTTPDDSPITAFAPDLDLLALSTYPHLTNLPAKNFPQNYFAPYTQSPWAIFETSWPTPTNDADQSEYLRRLLNICQNQHAQLLIWTATTDTAALPKVTTNQPQFNAAAHWMQYLGLYTLNGSPKPAALLWQNYFHRPLH